MSNASLAAIPLPGMSLGANKIDKAYLGAVKVWTRPAPIQDNFGIFGWLFNWINELIPGAGTALGGIVSALFTDPLGFIINGIGGFVGSIVNFIPSPTGGALLSAPSDAATAAVAGPETPQGILNGIPIIGPIIGDLLGLFTGLPGLSAITSILGRIPIVGQLGRLIGLLPAPDGTIAAPTNLVVNTNGAVLGRLSGGQYSASPARTVNVMPGVAGGMARMVVPFGLMSLPTQTARMRYSDAFTGDDGYLRATVALNGDPGMVTQVLRRYSNNGSRNNGVGFDLRSSQVSILRRVGGVDTLVAPAGSFQAGDDIRLDQDGDLHTLYVNGAERNAWPDDSHTAAMGADNRSVGLVMQAGQSLLGARQFSPALADVEAA